MSHKFHILFAFLVLFAVAVQANNVAITNQHLGAQNTAARTRIIQFDINWENSWRDSENYDAAWIFLKYSSDGGITWRHGTLKTSGTNPSGFSPGSGTGMDIVVPSDKKGAFLQRSGAGEGTVGTTGIQCVWDYGTDLGADATGDALAAVSTVRLNAVEMCYIPEHWFYVGDYRWSYVKEQMPSSQPMNASGTGPAGYGFDGKQAVVNSNDTVGTHNYIIKLTYYYRNADGYYEAEGNILRGPYDDAVLTGGIYYGLICYGYNGDGGTAELACPGIYFDGGSGISRTAKTAVDMNTNWPTGLKAFYYMRYEVTQAQYRDFLNTLTYTQATSRWANTSSARYSIKVDNDLYGCDYNTNGVFDEANDGECIPVSVASANDSLAFNDWMATRLPTEFEFEKAARGTNINIKYERAVSYVQGSYIPEYSLALDICPTGIFNSGTADEIPDNNADNSLGVWIYYGMTAVGGPMRSGSQATSTSNRKKAGSGYYGNMDLSGNIEEDCISVGTICGRSYIAAHGDGMLTSNGYHDVTGWPGGESFLPYEPAGTNWIALDYRALAQRGGEWGWTKNPTNGIAQRIYLSSRPNHTYAYGYNFRQTNSASTGLTSQNAHGLRGVRSGE